MSGPTTWQDYREHAHDWCVHNADSILPDADDKNYSERVRRLAQLLSEVVNFARVEERVATEREISAFLDARRETVERAIVGYDGLHYERADAIRNELQALQFLVERGEYRKEQP